MSKRRLGTQHVYLSLFFGDRPSFHFNRDKVLERIRSLRTVHGEPVTTWMEGWGVHRVDLYFTWTGKNDHAQLSDTSQLLEPVVTKLAGFIINMDKSHWVPAETDNTSQPQSEDVKMPTRVRLNGVFEGEVTPV